MPTTPNSLQAWRQLPVREDRAAWERFEPFLEQHGYKLFRVADSVEYVLVPPADCSPIRSEDDYNRFLPECLRMPPAESTFRPQTGIHVAARSAENSDVVIRIMAIGDDGLEHLSMMRALAAPDAQVPENRTVPMLRELQMDDVVFGVFPMMWDEGLDRPWFKTVREVLDALEEVFEGFAFLHQRLIAHRDFSIWEVFMNYGRDWVFRRSSNHCVHTPRVFRSECSDVRYLINDFELSVQFPPESDPATRLVTGIPIARYGGTAEEYCKPLAPETCLDKPYCPFKADIYQLGKGSFVSFRNMECLPALQDLLVAMSSDDPDARPTAAQALASLRAIREAAPEDVLNDIPTSPFREFRRILPGETCSCYSCKTGKILTAKDLNPQNMECLPASRDPSRRNGK